MARQRTPPRKVDIWMQVKDAGELVRARKYEHLSQRQLAYISGCSQTTIYLLETGQMRTLSDRLAATIAMRLRRPTESLFMPRSTTMSHDSGTAA